MNLQELKSTLFARGAAMGFTDMEVSYQSNNQFSGKVFKGEIDTYSIAVDGGLSFRGRYNDKMGYAYTELIDEAAIDSLLNGAKASAETIDSADTEPLYAGPFEYETVELFSEKLAQATPAQMIDLLKEIEAECFRLDKRIALVTYCNAQAVTSERMIANTRGLDRSEKVNLSFLLFSAVAREGSDTKSSFKILPVHDLAAIDPKAVAKEVVDEAISYLGAEPLESRPYPILLRNTAAASMLTAFDVVFFAENVQKGRSGLKGRIGEMIGSERVTLVDDPFLPGAVGSRSFDSEGVPSRRLNLMENGVLTSFLYNLKSAGVEGVASTGHGYKPSYKGAIATAPSNLYLKPGERSLEEMVADTDEAVIITSLQGLHSGANPISGDFSLAAHGYYVKGGKIVKPVNQITVAGNFYTVLQEIEEVGSDLEFVPFGANVGSPTLRIRSLAVAGK
ncbi:MAG: TldD/PmbA family protein [Bacillota bacterium]